MPISLGFFFNLFITLSMAESTIGQDTVYMYITIINY